MNSKEQRAIIKEHRLMHRALFKIMDLYAKAPGMAAPEPTPKLIWAMYQTALKSASKIAQR